MPPPAAKIATAANCADPAKTMADMTMAPMAENPASRATTPKDSASTPDAMAKGTPARTPRLQFSSMPIMLAALRRFARRPPAARG